MQKEIEDMDKNYIFKKEDIILPTRVKEYQKYQRRLERIKKLKEKK